MEGADAIQHGTRRTSHSSSSSISDAVQLLPFAMKSASGDMSDPIPTRPARNASTTTVPPPRKGSLVWTIREAERRRTVVPLGKGHIDLQSRWSRAERMYLNLSLPNGQSCRCGSSDTRIPTMFVFCVFWNFCNFFIVETVMQVSGSTGSVQNCLLL